MRRELVERNPFWIVTPYFVSTGSCRLNLFSVGERVMVNPSDHYKTLREHASVFGYGSLTKEERQFVLRYKKAAGITEEKQKRTHKVRRWSDVFIPRKKKSRKKAGVKVSTDRRLATWQAPGTNQTLTTMDSFKGMSDTALGFPSSISGWSR